MTNHTVEEVDAIVAKLKEAREHAGKMLNSLEDAFSIETTGSVSGKPMDEGPLSDEAERLLAVVRTIRLQYQRLHSLGKRFEKTSSVSNPDVDPAINVETGANTDA